MLLGDALVDRGKDVAALAGLVVGVGGGDLGDHLSFGFLVSLLLFFGVVTFVFWCRYFCFLVSLVLFLGFMVFGFWVLFCMSLYILFNLYIYIFM